MKIIHPRIFFICIILAVAANVTKATVLRQDEIADSLTLRLERTTTAADSIAILTDLGDLRP